MAFGPDGISDSSAHHFAHPSTFAQEHLFTISSMGRFDVSGDYRVNRFTFGSYLMLVPAKGTLSGTLDGQTATAAPGSVMLLDCYKPHAYCALEPGTFYFLHFGGAMSEQLCRLINGRCGLRIPAREPELFVRSIGGLIDLWETGAWDEYAASAAVYRLLLSLLADAADITAQVADRQMIAPVMDYIASHLSEKLTIEALASRFGYSAGNLTRLFRRYTGCSPYQFILRTRLDQSKHLLVTTSLPVQEIADRTGFSSLANFCSAFRKREGLTPVRFRRQSR